MQEEKADLKYEMMNFQFPFDMKTMTILQVKATFMTRVTEQINPVKNKLYRGITTTVLKNIFSISALIFLLLPSVHAQQAEAQLLKEPANWEFERFALPPVFAPEFSYTGAEELRFSPGMFKRDSTDYFTYAFVAQLDNITSISQDEIRRYLLDYFKGLCSSTARDRKLVVDTSKISADVDKKKNARHNEIIYNAQLNVFGVFADGAPVKLNMEIKVLRNVEAKKVYLVFIASPQEKTGKIWNALYKIQKDFKMPG